MGKHFWTSFIDGPYNSNIRIKYMYSYIVGELNPQPCAKLVLCSRIMCITQASIANRARFLVYKAMSNVGKNAKASESSCY